MSWCMCGGCEQCDPRLTEREPDEYDDRFCGVCGELEDECECFDGCPHCGNYACICDDYVDSPELFERLDPPEDNCEP